MPAGYTRGERALEARRPSLEVRSMLVAMARPS